MIDRTNIDEVLKELNVRSSVYESLVTRGFSESKDGVPLSVLSQRLCNEIERLGSTPAFVSIMEYVYGTVWAFSNMTTDDGDLIILRPDYVQRGMELVSNNRNLFGMYIFPLTLYGTEYVLQVRDLLREENIDVTNLDVHLPFNYDGFIQGLVGVAIQTRFCHIRDCLNHMDLGDEEFGQTDFSNVKITTHRIRSLEEDDGDRKENYD